ncbi:Hint domain-containing protein [uncultured Jannaschia sp.]|uniref:Hint domain-containing protein n=1 Tax=uncultured Jannaschia sp. TaxID=293347 RepID=UPI00260311CD|nr:Hint domain-containing protein [uncultured Jannaschia sp.]
MVKPVPFKRSTFATGPDDHAPCAFLIGTRVATSDGMRNVEMLEVGELVDTTVGPLKIAQIERKIMRRADLIYRRDDWPVRVPVGSLGNPGPLRLSPPQRVLLDGPTVERVAGMAEISVGIRDLVGLRGLIVERPIADLHYTTLDFGRPVVVEAEGVACEIQASDVPVVEREMARAAFTAMNAEGEPRLRTLR